MLVIKDLNVRYGMHEALTSVNLQVARDEIVVILGANGAGKSSLLGAIAGSCAGQVSGSVSLDGESLIDLDAAQVVERGIAFVPEGRGVFADLSVQENLQLGSYTEHARRNEVQSLKDVLTLFPKLEERKKQIVRTMSGGEQQMVAIGRALMSAPSILMLDEPSLGLSPLLCKELFSSLEHVRSSGVGILLVEQNAKQSLGIADRGYLLGNGEIIGHDSATQLLHDPNVQSAYLGGSGTSQSSKPKITEAAESIEQVSQIGEVPTKYIINPTNDQRSSQTVSSDSLVSEDISSIVARASTAAANHRDSDAALPMQVVKLATTQSSNAGRANRAVPGASHNLHSGSLPKTLDTEVQALLDEFEIAAQSAINKVSLVNDIGLKATTEAKRSNKQIDVDLPLPHIPVYKKSSVTVYRRDSSGELREKE